MNFTSEYKIGDPLICKNCGAHINPKTMQCDYCGVSYKSNGSTTQNSQIFYPFKIGGDYDIVGETIPVDMRRLKLEFGDRADDLIKEEVCKRIAKRLEPYIYLTEERSLSGCLSKVYGYIKILPVD